MANGQNCRTGNQNSLNQQGPQISYVTVVKKSVGGAKADVICKFSFPVTKIWVASKADSHSSDSLYLHLMPLGKVYSSNAIAPDGSETWFCLSWSVESGTTTRGSLLSFKVPVQTVYLDIGQESAGSDYNITMAGSNDIDDLSSVSIGQGPN